jgi:DNA segregation ATPase FtsK/SpoIIIE, S-DNA-T family
VKHFFLALVVATGFVAAAHAALPPEKQADLDGHYAGIQQRGLERLEAVKKAGRMAPAEADQLIAETQDQLKRLRAPYANSPLRAAFEKGYQDELHGLGAGGRVRTPPQGTETTGTTTGQGSQSPSPPLQLSPVAKIVIFVAMLWIARRLWKMKPAAAKANPVTPVEPELSPAEKSQLASAQKGYEKQQVEITQQDESLRRQIGELAASAAALASEANRLAQAGTSAASAELNKAVPEYDDFLADIERRFPVRYARWSSPVWIDFARDPQPEVLGRARIGEFDEENLLPGEQGIQLPWTVALLDAKGPVIIKCTPATKALARAIVQNLVLRAALAAPAGTAFSLLDFEGLGAGFPMSRDLPRVRASTSNPTDQIRDIVEDIRRINTNIVAQAESFAALAPEKRAGEVFEIVAALDYPSAYKQDSRAIADLARIAQAGPRAGRHLILEWVAPEGDTAARPPGLEALERPELLDVARVSAGVRIDRLPPAETQKTLLAAAAAAKSRANVTPDWNSQVRPAAWFSESSARMIETPVGEGLRVWFGDNRDGKPCAHGMLAGQTGSGKSFLLHVIITGFAARYSPDELRLVLVDGKQGVEFEAYRNLPHARVVCLRTSPAIARSVLEDFIAEMDDRYIKFQQKGVTKLEDYRRKTGEAMPRMLMVVDEFQQLLEGDPERGALMLSRVLEKGRAAGIHLLLGSQTFEARGFPSSAMAHVHLRAALSLPVDYIQTMSAFTADGKKLIRELAPSGQVVINDEGGRENVNTRGAVTRLDASAGSGLPAIVSQIIAAAASPLHAIVLSGNDAAVLADNPFVRQWSSRPPEATELQATARRSVRDGGFGMPSWSAADRPLPLWLGRKFDVHGHLVVPLRRAAGHNLLALGSDNAVRLLMLANSLASLRSMRPLIGCEVLLLDGLSEGQPGAGMLEAALGVLAESGARVERAAPDTGAAVLEKFASAALQPQNPDSFRLLVVSEPEYFPALAAPSGYGGAPSGPSRALKDLLRGGPALGSHSIVTASGLGSLASILHPSREASLFNHRAVQQCNDEESMTLFSSLAATRIMAQTDHHMSGMYVDTVQGVRAAQLFKAYAASADIYGDQSSAGLMAALSTLYPSNKLQVAAG